MRGTQEQSSARIAWLENIIRTNLPHINLSDGPSAPPSGQLEGSWSSPDDGFGILEMPLSSIISNIGSFPQIMESSSGQSTEGNLRESLADCRSGVDSSSGHATPGTSTGPSIGTKRTFGEATSASSTLQERSFDQDARSVALELGLLSLNSDSRQRHYLGSSSGRFFASLFLARKPATTSATDTSSAYSPNGSGGRENPANRAIDIALVLPEYQKDVEDLFNQLRKVWSQFSFKSYTAQHLIDSTMSTRVQCALEPIFQSHAS